MGLPLSQRQARTVAAAVTTVAALVLLLSIALLGWLIAWFLRAFSSVFLPLAVGAIAALVLRPLYEMLHLRARLPSPVAVALVLATILLPLAAFLWFFGQILLLQIAGLVAQAPAWWAQIHSWLAARVPQLLELLRTTGIDERLQQLVAGQQTAIAGGLQSIGAHALSAGLGLARGLGTLLAWAVLPVYFVYFLTARGLRFEADDLLPFLKAETRSDATWLAHEFVGILVAFFRGQLIIALLQGLLYAAGFTLVGLRYGFAIGLLFGLLNIIPYLGSIVGLAVTVPLSLLQPGGGWRLALAALLVFVFVQQIEGWILTPKIMGQRTGLHFMAIIVAIFFWGTALGGVLGMIVAIPLTAFLASLWRLARDKYIPEII